MTGTRLIPIGRIVGVFGIKGWVKVQSYTDPPHNILSYSPWLLQQNGQWIEHKLDCGRAHGKGFVAHLQRCDDRDTAALFIGAEIAITREQLPPLPAGEYYWDDLVGLNVLNQQGQELGQVSHLFATGANDVVVVKMADVEHFIPYVPGQYIMNIDIPGRRMIVDWEPLEDEADDAI